MAAATTIGGVRDRISNLPDSILVTILSGLPIDKAARCSILSSRWRHLFPSTLLDFRAFTCSGKLDAVKAVTAILAAHPAERIRSFEMGELFRRPEDKRALDGWLHDLSNRGIQDLSLYFNCFADIPESIFACCSSLQRLRLTNGTFPDAAAAATSLPRLTEINLSGVRISGDSLSSLLTQCAALEHLTIDSDVKTLRLQSRSLKVLNSTGDFDQLFIDDAPNLERVHDRFMHQRKAHIKVVHAPKLHFLGYIGMSNIMEIGDTSFTEELIDVKSFMPSMKTLAIDLSCDNQRYIKKGYIGWLVQLLKLFPCLETLYIKSSRLAWARDVVSGSREVQTPVHCILEKVVFQVYRGNHWQREMARFLHARSEVLKTMEFHCVGDVCREGFCKPPSEEWVRQQKEILRLDSAAAREASFLFFKRQLPCKYLEVCNEEQHLRNYHHDMYFDQSVFRGQSWRA